MLAHPGLGRISRGLAVYTECRRTLADQVGASPGPRVEAVYEELLARS